MGFDFKIHKKFHQGFNWLISQPGQGLSSLLARFFIDRVIDWINVKLTKVSSALSSTSLHKQIYTVTPVWPATVCVSVTIFRSLHYCANWKATESRSLAQTVTEEGHAILGDGWDRCVCVCVTIFQCPGEHKGEIWLYSAGWGDSFISTWSN